MSELLRLHVNRLYTVSVCSVGFLVNIWRVKDNTDDIIKDIV